MKTLLSFLSSRAPHGGRARPCAFPALAAFAAALLPGGASAQSVPAERPRARPPSMLTERAQWEKGADLLKRIKVPPAPPLSPANALQAFRVAPGYRVELFAAEPLVENPIFMEFDPDGRLWVVEYQGYMRDIQGSGEGDPVCRVVVLEDTDADGRADRSTVFLDGLAMPRSLAFVKGGVLVLEPPRLWFCEDRDGDLKCDARREVGRMAVAGNPQHTGNGLRYGIDNWLHSADWPARHRWQDGRLIEEPAVHRGQFGVTFDDTGRFLTCRESNALNGDLFPEEYLRRNPALGKVAGRLGRGGSGLEVKLATDDAHVVYPIRVTPAITLGAMELRDDGRLRTYTIVAGSGWYDGDQFPDDARGNVFVPEAGGHLIGRLRFHNGVRPTTARFYPPEQEFLASTDERFRPVNCRVGPDGALYIADLYKGIIEHVIFMVPWISDQVRDRRLDTGHHLGRIYRVVADGRPIDRRPPQLARATTADLLGHLSHANGWWRITAQRLLVERADPAAVPRLREIARRGPEPLGRLHALWTLQGVGALDFSLALALCDDADERVRAAALRLSERVASGADQAALLARLRRATADPAERVRLQAVLTASALPAPESTPVLLALARSHEDPVLAVAALTGRAGREFEVVRMLAAEPGGAHEKQSRRLLVLAVQCIVESRAEAAAGALLDLLGGDGPANAWPRAALLEGLVASTPERATPPKPLTLAREPAALMRLARQADASIRQAAYRVLDLFTWPGARAMLTDAAGAPALSAAQLDRVERGQPIYTTYCAPCHQAHGGGLAGVAPPLAGSDWVAGPEERLARIVLHGLFGPIEVNGTTWNLNMPGFGGAAQIDDDQIAAALSYVRRAWGNAAAPVEPALVAAVRKATAARTLPWTSAELAAIGGAAAPPTAAALRPEPSGEIMLPAARAELSARRLGYRPALDVLAPWTVATDVAAWRVEVPVAGTYEVAVLLAADDESAGDFFVVETEGSRARGEVRSTGGYENFREQPAGRLALRAGANRIILRPDGPLVRELADVRAVRLVPVP